MYTHTKNSRRFVKIRFRLIHPPLAKMPACPASEHGRPIRQIGLFLPTFPCKSGNREAGNCTLRSLEPRESEDGQPVRKTPKPPISAKTPCKSPLSGNRESGLRLARTSPPLFERRTSLFAPLRRKPRNCGAFSRSGGLSVSPARPNSRRLHSIRRGFSQTRSGAMFTFRISGIPRGHFRPTHRKALAAVRTKPAVFHRPPFRERRLHRGRGLPQPRLRGCGSEGHDHHRALTSRPRH